MNKKMPVIFAGHGTVMTALEHNEWTEKWKAIGEQITEDYGKPKAILSISAHWYTHGTCLQSAAFPEQIYDTFEYPEEINKVRYHVKGCHELTDDVQSLLKDQVRIDDEWGIDSGTWSVLVHMFPFQDVPVVQLSLNADLKPKEHYALAEKLLPLRKKGYLILGSGDIVHNRCRVEWQNDHGTNGADEFDEWIRQAVLKKETIKLIHYQEGPFSGYAVPTPEHYLPFLYICALGKEDKVQVFNYARTLGSVSMTGYAFGMK